MDDVVLLQNAQCFCQLECEPDHQWLREPTRTVLDKFEQITVFAELSDDKAEWVGIIDIFDIDNVVWLQLLLAVDLIIQQCSLGVIFEYFAVYDLHTN